MGTDYTIGRDAQALLKVGNTAVTTLYLTKADKPGQ